MIIKKESRCKKTGEIKSSYTTDKPGYKVVIQKGEPVEEKMSCSEKSNRDHGAKTKKHGAVGSSNVQKGQTRANVEGAKKYREKNNLEEAKIKTVTNTSKKVETLRQKLRKAKLDQIEALLVKRESELIKKEKQLKGLEKFAEKDRKQLKNKHSYYIADTDKGLKTKKLKADIVNRIEDMYGDLRDEEIKKENVKESTNLLEKMKKVDNISKIYGMGNRKDYYGKDVVDRLSTKLDEADDEEDEDKKKEDDKLETDPFEGTPIGDSEGEDKSGDVPEEPSDKGPSLDDEPADLEGGDEPLEEPTADEDNIQEPEEEEQEPNEITHIVDREEYNVDVNNAYDYYDFIIDKVFTNNAIKAINTEYSQIPKEKRKITPASDFHKTAVKRLDLMDKAEKDRLETELGGTGEEEASAEDELSLK